MWLAEELLLERPRTSSLSFPSDHTGNGRAFNDFDQYVTRNYRLAFDCYVGWRYSLDDDEIFVGTEVGEPDVGVGVLYDDKHICTCGTYPFIAAAPRTRIRIRIQIIRPEYTLKPSKERIIAFATLDQVASWPPIRVSPKVPSLSVLLDQTHQACSPCRCVP